MDPSEQQHDVTRNGHMAPTLSLGNSANAVSPPAQHPHQHAFQQAQQFQHQQQLQQLQMFWANQMHEIDHTTDFRNHSLPLARIKKIMKADEDVRMISAEAPVIFAKACEMFILELTMRAWSHTEENKRRTLQKNDIAAAISKTDVFDFLVDILPRDELKEDAMGVTRTTFPYYYPQHQPQAQPHPHPHVVGPSGIPMGMPADQNPLYATQQPRPPMPFMNWIQDQDQNQTPQSDQNQTPQPDEKEE